MKVYKVTGPAGLDTTVQLSDEDAKARGLKSSDQVGEVDDAVRDFNTVGVDDKDHVERIEHGVTTDGKADVPSNKSATPANKAGSK